MIAPRWERTRRAVLARDARTCHYCGQPANTVDHVIPRAEGGTHTPSNLVACCQACNSRRSLAWITARRAGGISRGRFFGRQGTSVTSNAGFGPVRTDPARSTQGRPPTGALAPELEL
jgi:5-methylcytosine-specific restriction endonuclease McrA